MSVTLAETRKISGKGILRIPTEAIQSRYYVLYAEVIRPPSQPYLSFAWNPPRSRYGNLCFMFKGTVLKAIPIEFDRQSFIDIPDIAGQVLIALKCVLDANNESIVNLGLSLPRPPISVNNPITGYLNLDLMWDEVRLCCYADTAIQLTLYVSAYDACNPAYALSDSGGEPLEPPTKVPANTPIDDISEPYDAATGDDGNTSPLEIDVPPTEVEEGIWLLTWTQSSGNPASGNYPGFSDDTWAIVAGASPSCNLSGNSALIRNGSEIVEAVFNCNPAGFVSTLLSAAFTANS